MYNDALGPAKDGGIVLLTSGTLRGDSVYGPGTKLNYMLYLRN